MVGTGTVSSPPSQFLVATLLPQARSSGWVTLFLHHSGCAGWALVPREEGAQAGGEASEVSLSGYAHGD